MRGCLLLAQKDLIVLFRSPLAYAILTCFLFISGYFFLMGVQTYQLLSMQVMQNPAVTGFTPMEYIINPYLDNTSVILLFIIPLLTMRGFSEEKKMGTFEVLMSYPLKESQLVSGKLLALAVFMFLALVLSAISPALLFTVSEPQLVPMLLGYGGIFLLSLSFCAIGLFFSSLTENQIVAAICTFAALLVLWLLNWLEQLGIGQAGAVIAQISPLGHVQSFLKGVLEVKDLVYYVTFVLGFAWLTLLSLENQRWRG